ncbi:MAG: hypothetical protein U0869_20310 [Chloroflexota bacterium]
MSPGLGVLILLALGGAAIARVWSERRVRAGDRRTAPILLFSTLLIALLLAGAGVWFAFRTPLLGIPLTIGALLLGGVWLRVSLDMVRYAGPQRAPDRMDDLAERMARSYRAIGATLLAFGFGGAVLLVMYLFARARF